MWIFVGIVWMCIPLFLLWRKGKYGRSFVENSPECKQVPAPVGSMGLWLYDRFLKRRMGGEEKTIRAVYPDRNPSQILRGQMAYMLGIVWCLCLCGGVLFTLCAASLQADDLQITQVERPAFGQEQQITLQVLGLEEDLDLRIQVDGQEPTKEEMEHIFDQVMEREKNALLGNNQSFDQIYHNLNFFTSTDYGIHVSYESLSPQYLSNRGVIVAREIPEEGILINVKMTLSYEAYEKSYIQEFTLLPPKVLLTEKEALEDYLSQLNQDTVQSETFALPEEWQGMALEFRKENNSTLEVFLLLPVIVILLILLPKARRKQELKQRNEELAEAYPNFLSKLEMLIQTGLSLRSVWQRLGHDYEETKAAGGEKSYVYEELCLSLHRMESGYPEGDCYLWFGQNCGLHSYMKLGNLLSQNLRQGISGLANSLEAEMTLALEERQNRALRKGEEASTKLLFPMFLMLGIVIVVLIVPAFLSF